jgi:outer membrane lipoprotein carrier protein
MATGKCWFPLRQGIRSIDPNYRIKIINTLFKSICLSALLVAPLLSAKTEDATASLRAKLEQLKSYQANFTQQVVDGQGELLQNAQGQLSLKQPNRMHWQVAEPNENTLIADGQTLWHIDPFVEQVVAIDQARAIENNPMILLTNPQSDAWQDFIISQLDNCFVIQAKDVDAQVASLTLVFDGETLMQLKVEDHQQQTSTLDFDDIRQNQQIDDLLFKFVMPEGYELDDQRSQ